MDKIKFSIIVPCFNVEKYIDECVRSLLGQTYVNFEIILIDDGSTDGTSDICINYSNIDNRVIYIRKENEGLSAARNLGIKHATGEYIVFVDGDDYITSNALENFYNCIREKKDDIVVTSLIEAYPNGECLFKDSELYRIITNESPSEDVIDALFTKSKNFWPAVKYIVSKNYIVKNNLYFLYGFLHEDMDWTSRLFLYDAKCVFCNNYWYYHRMQRKGSITNTISSKSITDVIKMAVSLLKDIDSSEVRATIKEQLKSKIMASVYDMFPYFQGLNKDEKYEVIMCCEEHIDVLTETKVFKYKLFLFFSQIVGFKISFSLLSIYINMLKRIK